MKIAERVNKAILRGHNPQSFTIIFAVIFVAALFMACFSSWIVPDQISQDSVLINYEHHGQFDYQVYLKPSYLFGPEPEPSPIPATPTPTPTTTSVPLSNLKYPADDIDRFKFTFDYRFISDQPVRKVSGNLEVTASSYTKTEGQSSASIVTALLPKTPFTGDFQANFVFVPPHEITDGDFDLNINVYPVIETDQGLVFESFNQVLAIHKNKSIIEVERAGLGLSQPGNLGSLTYRQEGKLGYSTLMLAGSPFGAITVAMPEIPEKTPAATVTPTPVLPAKIIGPGEVIFNNLVDHIDATFTYDLLSDHTIKSLTEEVTLTATLENPNVWTKTFILVPTTGKSGSFTLNFPIEMAQYLKTLENIRNETGVSGESYKLTIKADIHAMGQTDFGTIDETFSPVLSTELGKGTLEWTEKLQQSKAGSIATTAMGPNNNKYLGLSIGSVRTLTWVILVICAILLGGLLYLDWNYRPKAVTTIEKEVQRIHKKYGSQIVDVSKLGADSTVIERTISMKTVDDLVKIADELTKPVIHQASDKSPQTHAYYVIDGSTRYYYVLNPEPEGRPTAETPSGGA